MSLPSPLTEQDEARDAAGGGERILSKISVKYAMISVKYPSNLPKFRSKFRTGAMNCEEKKIIAQLDVTDMNDMNCSTVSHVPCPPNHDRCCSELVRYATRSNTRRRAIVGHWTK